MSEKITDNTQFEIMRLLQDVGHLRNNMKELHSIENKSKGAMLVAYRPSVYDKLCSKYKVCEIRVRSDFDKPYRMIVEGWKLEESGALSSTNLTFDEHEGQDLIAAIKEEIVYWIKRRKEIRTRLKETFENIQAGKNHFRSSHRK